MVKFLDLNKQYQGIKAEIDAAIAQVIADSAYINGPRVKAFEQAFAAYQQAKYCVGVANGTDALEIAIEALDLPRGKIIVPANTFIASAEAITRVGHQVEFCDCNPDNYTLSIEDLKKRITPETRAIVAVHLYGHPCDMDEILKLAKQHNLKVIEDCAQAHGAEYKGHRVGSIGDVGCFSFYPGKNLGAYGDAGAILSNSEAIATRARMIANHGRIEKYNHEFEGRNSRLDGMQAAILNAKLGHLDNWIAKRRNVAARYLEGLKSCPSITLPKAESWANPAYHLFVIRTEDRDGLQAYLKEQGIQTGIHYPIALPKLKAFDYWQGNPTVDANRLDCQLLSLPMGDHLELDEVDEVIKAVLAYQKA